jgi:hypothetical protein
VRVERLRLGARSGSIIKIIQEESCGETERCGFQFT